MKTRHLVAIGLASLAFTFSRAATPADPHAELRELKSVYEKAIASGDLSPLESLFDAGSSGVTVDNQSFRTFADLKAIYAAFHAKFPGVVYRVELDAEPSLIEGDLAVARGTAKEYVKTADAEFTYPSSWTAVLRRTDTGWKLVRSQVTMDPFRNSIVSHLSRKAVLQSAFACLVGGIVLGFIIGAVFFRRRPAA